MSCNSGNKQFGRAATFGGMITESDVLNHIISIGYEFETNKLAKLSLFNDKYLINTANKTGDLVDELKSDDNYFVYEATLDLGNTPETSFFESSETTPSIHTAPTIASGEIDAEFEEYMLEPRPKDGKKTKVAITNDISNSSFIKMLNTRCRGREEEKNALYVFMTRDGKTYPIKFDSDMRKVSCGSFSGLEIVITYYKPKRGPNVIVETFADACERLLDHLSGLKEQRGDLFMANKKKGGYTALGKIPYRKLYHKEGTNLYYLETYDGLYTNTRTTMSSVSFKPQMTYCTNVEHVYDVIRYLTLIPETRRMPSAVSALASGYDDYGELMDLCIIPLIENYNNANASYAINMETNFGKLMRNYLFLMYLKLDAYIIYFEKQKSEELYNINTSKDYLKNYCYMFVRHTNYELYARMKYHMKKQFNTKNKETVRLLKELMYNKEHLSTNMYPSKPEIFGPKPSKTDANYGDPKVSLESYFDFFENPKDKERDWLIHSETDGNSTMYPLKGDNIIIETRIFIGAAIHYYKTLNKRIRSKADDLSMKQLADIVAAVKNKPQQNIIMGLNNKELNPSTGRMVLKCAEGKVRNENFRCIKPKTPKQTKPKAARTRRAADNK